MYDENSFKRFLIFVRIKRIFLLILFSILGAAIGVLISSYLVDVLLFATQFRTIIITVSTLLFFLIALLLTSNTTKTVQDGYWKIAVLRKLTLISKKLDNLDNLEYLDNFLNQNNNFDYSENKMVKSSKNNLPTPYNEKKSIKKRKFSTSKVDNF